VESRNRGQETAGTGWREADDKEEIRDEGTKAREKKMRTMAAGSRNMGLGPTDRIYIAAGRSTPAPANGRGRGPLLPGSFSLPVVERGVPN
jgi:hypothetical protein